MINFYRRIRQQLLATNKLSKYLIYAVGEIILVVIGILIALQINIWNENREQEVLKISYRNALINDLSSDTLLLSELIKENQRVLQVLDRQRERFLGPDTPIDTLVHIARFEFDPNLNTKFQYNRNTLNTLISSGNINLFPKDFNEMLFSLIAKQDMERGTSDYLSSVYFSKISRFSDDYPVSRHKNSSIVKLIWTDINGKTFASGFVSLTDIKGYTHYSFIEGLENVKEYTTELLRYINDPNL